MNWDAIAAIGEIAGALAVVVTLVFMSRQMRKTAQQLSLASATEANTLFNEAFAPIYNNDHNMQIWVHGLRDPESVPEEDLELPFFFMARLITMFETVAESREQLGTLDSEKFQRQSHFIGKFLESPGGRMWVEDASFGLSTDTMRWLRSS